MHKLLVLYPEPADRGTFDTYYRATHLPLVRKLPGVRDVQYSLGLTGDPYYAVFEATFDSTEQFAAAMSSAEGQAVAADVPNYATGGAVVIDFAVTSDEHAAA
ncbi:EthD family reductase [Paenarthrobacter aurescens]|jgi:uncharacterized protein (TIGR02118 family)|nr:EthD family reductase [Paenarthrobacter aurescens]